MASDIILSSVQLEQYHMNLNFLTFSLKHEHSQHETIQDSSHIRLLDPALGNRQTPAMCVEKFIEIYN